MEKSVPPSPGAEVPTRQHLIHRLGEDFGSKGFTFGFLPSLLYKLQAVSLLYFCLEHPSAFLHG